MIINRIWHITRFPVTAAALFVLWLLFTARMDLFSLISGFIGAIAIAALTYQDFITVHDASLRSILPRPFHLAAFFGMLVFSLYHSSMRMLASVASGKANPRIVHFRTVLRSDISRMVLANCISLTPGTTTLDLNGNRLTVYWFFCNTNHKKDAGKEVKGRMEKLAGKVWQ